MISTEQSKGMALHCGGSAENRVAGDHYATPKECTVALMNFLSLSKMPFIWEPACGKGDISEVLAQFDAFVYSTDLFDYGYGETGVDYLNTEPPPDLDAIITNPPFNLSELFIEKAVSEAPIVAMLLKSQYWHAAKRLKIFRKHVPKFILPFTWRPNFMESKGKAPVMEAGWTVWDNTHTGPCIYYPLQKPT